MVKITPIVVLDTRYKLVKQVTILSRYNTHNWVLYAKQFEYNTITDVIEKLLSYAKVNNLKIDYLYDFGVKWYNILFVDIGRNTTEEYPYLEG